MSRRDATCLAVVLGLIAPAGCSHLVETRSVTRFTGAFEDRDISALRDATSTEFRKRALRDKSAVEAMDLLELPEGKVSVAEVEEVSNNRRRVKVEFESDDQVKTPMTFELSREGKSGAWLVDDLLLKQSRRGKTVTRSATDLMDLLLSVHEFQRAWASGERQRLLASTSESFSEKLSQIPAPYLTQLANRVAVRDGRTFSSRPRASLDKGTAQVRYNGPEGETVLALTLEPAGWRVDDIVFSSTSSKRRPESVRLLASVIARAAGFLDAYNTADRPGLKEHSSSRFFSTCLARADLSELELPRSAAIDAKAEVRLQKTFSDILVKRPGGMVRLSLEREAVPDTSSKTGDLASSGFRVNEVTLVDFSTQQERRVSAVFTAQARMRLFLAAARQHDLLAIRHNSSTDFNTRVWNQVSPTVLPEVLGLAFSEGQTQVSGTVFQGAVTEITITQGNRALTCVLREQNGVLLVDDIMVPTTTLPGSLKKQFERLIPVIGFRQAIQRGDASEVSAVSSADFNRLVWSQVDDRFPAQAGRVARFLRPMPTQIRVIEDGREEVTLGDRQFGARVALVKESRGFRVDDVELLAGAPVDSRPTMVKQVLRLEIARPQKRDRPAPVTGEARKLDVPAGPTSR